MAIAALVVAGIGLLLTIILYASLPALEGWVEEQCAANPDIQGCEEYQPNDGAAAHVPVAYAAWLPARPVWLPS